MNKITRNCKNCNLVFETRQSYINRGHGKFCSLRCSSQHHMRQKSIKHADNCTCSTCGKTFYRTPSQLLLSKSGLYFCSRSCKDKAQRIDGMKELHPPHYGTSDGSYRYREIAFESYEQKCMDCGFDEHPEVLEIHHIDKDHGNANPKNLAVLCPTCHQVRHFKEGSGKWKRPQ